MSEITQFLKQMGSGDANAEERLLSVVYDELKRIAASKLSRERPGHTLQTTALVNEAYMRLVGKKSKPATDDSSRHVEPDSQSNRHQADADQPGAATWESRGHFFASAAEAMRRILIDNARKKRSKKRGGDQQQVPLDDVAISLESSGVDLESLDRALTKLEQQNATHAAVVKLRYFTGMTIEQTADALGSSPATVKRSWAFSKAWLKREMGDG